MDEDINYEYDFVGSDMEDVGSYLSEKMNEEDDMNSERLNTNNNNLNIFTGSESESFNPYEESPQYHTPLFNSLSEEEDCSFQRHAHAHHHPHSIFQRDLMNKTEVERWHKMMEPLFRKVISEEVEKAITRILLPRLGRDLIPWHLCVVDSAQSSHPRRLKLKFKVGLSSSKSSATSPSELTIFTAKKILGEGGQPLVIVLEEEGNNSKEQGTENENVVESGPDSCMKVEIVVLDGDWPYDHNNNNWSPEDFEKGILRERSGKKPLLIGDYCFTLQHGRGIIHNLEITDNTSWIRSRKFKLGVRICGGSGFSASSGLRVIEASTAPFVVKDHRGSSYMKHYPPTLNDEVWRLKGIGKGGPLHKSLQVEAVSTVCDFLRLHVKDQHKLRNILGNSNKTLDSTIQHAQTCSILNQTNYFYSPPGQNLALIFNVICELIGIVLAGRKLSLTEIDESMKSHISRFQKYAYENWNEVQELPNNFLANCESVFSTSQPPILQTSQGNVCQIRDFHDMSDMHGSMDVSAYLHQFNGTMNVELGCENACTSSNAPFSSYNTQWNQYFDNSIESSYGYLFRQTFPNTQEAPDFRLAFSSEHGLEMSGNSGWTKIRAVLLCGMMYARKTSASKGAMLEELDE